MAELAARHAGREAVVADGDLLVDKLVGKVVGSLGHGADKDTHALLGPDAFHPVPDTNQRRIETERHLAAVGRQVIGDGVLDDLEELLLGGGGADRETVQELHHQTGKALEGSGDADGGRDLDQDALGGVDVDLQLASLVDGRVEQGEKALG